MPLVRIATQGKPKTSAARIGDIVARTMIDLLYVPGKPKMQVITEYSSDPLSYASSAGETEHADLAVIEIALADGRPVELKNKFYQAVVENLKRELGLRPADILINLIEVKYENWAWRNN